MPDDGRVRIRPGDFAVLFDDGLHPLRGDRLLRVCRVEGQLGADVAALGRIDAPEMADAFAVLGIFADGDVDQAIVDHRRADDVIARGGAPSA